MYLELFYSKLEVCVNNTREFHFVPPSSYIVSLYHTKYVSVKTQLYLDNRFCVSGRATRFCLYVGRFQADTISEAHIEEDNVSCIHFN